MLLAFKGPLDFCFILNPSSLWKVLDAVAWINVVDLTVGTIKVLLWPNLLSWNLSFLNGYDHPWETTYLKKPAELVKL